MNCRVEREVSDYVRDPSRKVANLSDECARRVGEQVRIARYVRWEVA